MASTEKITQLSPALQEYFKSESAATAQNRRTPAELEEGADLDLGDLDITTAQISLAGVEEQLEHFANHDVLKAILDQGCDPKEYGEQYEAKLRQAELESIQDYITESDNLVELHDQVIPEYYPHLIKIRTAKSLLICSHACLGYPVRHQLTLKISTSIWTVFPRLHVM